MKVLLLIPKEFYQSWPIHNDAAKFIYRVLSVVYPLLASLYPDAEFTIFDASIRDIDPKSYFKLINMFDVVCMNCPESVVALNIEMNIRLIKIMNPKIKIIVGGHHATFYSKEWIEKGADIVVRGEAEKTFPEILDVFNRGKGIGRIQGITYLRDFEKADAGSNRPKREYGKTEIVFNEERGLLDNLDLSPIPRWEKVDLQYYDLGLGAKGLSACIETSRGCLHKCSFCCVGSMFGNVQRFKSVERTMEEFELLHARGVRQVHISDDNFGSNVKRDAAILEGLIKKNFGFKLGASMRADVFIDNPEFIKLAVSAGLKLISVGFESLEDSDITLFDKNYKIMRAKKIDVINHYERIYRMLNKNKITVIGLFVNGFPGQRISSLTRKNVNRVCDLGQFSNFKPVVTMPGYAALLKDKNIEFKNMFYNDKFIPTFRFKGKNQMRTLPSWKSILSINKFFSHSPIVKMVLLRVYQGAWRSVFMEFRMRKIINFIISIMPFIAPDKKQDRINKYYLNNKYLYNIIKSNKFR